MAILFSSVFDDTVSPFGWTGVNLSGTNVVEVSSEHPFSGNYGLKCTLDIAAVPGSFAGVYQQFSGTPNRAHIFMRAMSVMVDQLPKTEGQHLSVHGAWTLHSQTMIGVGGFAKVGGVLRWLNWYRNNGAFVVQVGGFVPQLNTPYCLELEIKQNSAPGVADGAQRLYVDGVLVLEATGIINDDRVINYVAFGLNNAEGNATTPIHMWGDDFVLADQYIGPVTVVVPKQTVNTNPELNVPVYVDNQLAGNTPLTVPLAPGTHTIRVETEVER